MVGAAPLDIEDTVWESQRLQPTPNNASPVHARLSLVAGPAMGTFHQVDMPPRILVFIKQGFWWPCLSQDMRAFMTACCPEQDVSSAPSWPAVAPAHKRGLSQRFVPFRGEHSHSHNS